MKKLLFSLVALPLSMFAQKTVKLITLDPGHFHAALIQKSMYPQVDPTVHVYAEEGRDLRLHMERIDGSNKRNATPTSWKEEVYTGKDFFEKMIAEKKGNVVVLAGNNRLKTDYILSSIKNGFHVFADKPMAIDSKGFNKLKTAFSVAQKSGLQLYDIMTERNEITTMLQRAFSMESDLFGTLEKGTPEDPSVTKISVHHFYKYVSGSVLTRPSWFFDDKQQGAGIVDVTTHLVAEFHPLRSLSVIWAIMLTAISAGDLAPIFRPTGAWMRAIWSSVKPSAFSRSTRFAWVRVDPRHPR